MNIFGLVRTVQYFTCCIHSNQNEIESLKN